MRTRDRQIDRRTLHVQALHMTKPLTVTTVGRIIGRSRTAVIRQDARLQPERGPLGERLYDESRVSAELNRRVDAALARRGGSR